MLSVGLGIGLLLLIIVVIRIVSVDPPRPIVVRVDEVGRAEAIAYEAMEAQADPLDPTTKYFLNRFIYGLLLAPEGHGPKELVPQSALPDHGTRQRLVSGRESEYRSSRGRSGKG